jgi:hypothetical protein
MVLFNAATTVTIIDGPKASLSAHPMGVGGKPTPPPRFDHLKGKEFICQESAQGGLLDQQRLILPPRSRVNM